VYRRELLAAAGSATAVALAGCTGGDGDEATTEAPTETTAESTAAATTAEATTEERATTGASTVAGDATTVVVAPEGDLAFDPGTVTVAVGDTVRWEWDGSGHNVRPDSRPDGADWTGTPGGAGETYDSGHEYAHTFEVAGRYEYYCAPHRSVGMTGAVVVEE